MIVTGDARDLPLDDGTVRLVVTSPPYLGLRSYTDDADEIGAEGSIDEYVKALVEVLDGLDRVLTADGNVFINLGDRTAGNGRYRNFVAEPSKVRSATNIATPDQRIEGRKGSLAALPHRLVLEAIDRSWVLRSEIVWHKTNPMPDHSTTRRPMRTHELVLHLTKTDQNYAAVTSRPLHSVWSIAGERLRLPERFHHHAAAMPTELARIVVDHWSEPGDLVLDPFGGTGTTALVADVLGRRFCTVDLDPECADIARWRIHDPGERSRVATRQRAVTDRDGSQGRCEACGGSLTGMRLDARYCSAACKQAAYRASQSR